jgi:putative lumazine-binding protein
MTATVEGILREYFDGLYHGDTDRLSRVFHPQAIYASATGGERLPDHRRVLPDRRRTPVARIPP